MKRSRLLASIIGVAIVVVGLLAWMVGLGARPRLGLDLQGGISVILTPVTQPGQPVDDEVLDETIEVIRSRVDSLGVAEPEIARQGDDVLVQLPGLEDRERALSVIGRTAKLTFRPVLEAISPADPRYLEAGPDCSTNLKPEQPVPDDQEAVLCGSPDDAGETIPEQAAPSLKYRVGPAALTGQGISDARAVNQTTGQGQLTNDYVVSLQLSGDAADRFGQITADLACKRDQGDPGGGRFAIVLDGVVESAPGVDPQVQCGVGIAGGEAQITVGGEQEAAQDLALVLRTGALPVTLEPSTAYNVSPTLGAAALRAGIIAGLIGLALVAAYLIFFYRWLGVIGVGGLAVFAVWIVGLISLLGEAGFTLTLAGIAGVIVSVAIAADSSILYFERIRDELELGKTMRTAVMRAFQPSFRTNLTANTVTFVAAVILYFLAVGPVRGFAFTLGLSTVIDLVILYLFTRPCAQLLGGSRFLTRRSARVAIAPQAAGGAR
ncbi:MAG: protein translocase subunit SecD [Actinomycetota bacterium]|nr:protein translocase subunit SecD [Actinomycetota bacterium]